MPEPVFFLEHHVAFKIVHVFDQLAFRYNLQLMLSGSLFHPFLSLSMPDITIPRASNCFLATQYVNLRNVLCDMAHTKILSGWGKRWQVFICFGKWNFLILRRDFDTKVEEVEWGFHHKVLHANVCVPTTLMATSTYVPTKSFLADVPTSLSESNYI